MTETQHNMSPVLGPVVISSEQDIPPLISDNLAPVAVIDIDFRQRNPPRTGNFPSSSDQPGLEDGPFYVVIRGLEPGIYKSS